MQARTINEIKAFAMAKKGFGASEIANILNYNSPECFKVYNGGVSQIKATPESARSGIYEVIPVITSREIVEGNMLANREAA